MTSVSDGGPEGKTTRAFFPFFDALFMDEKFQKGLEMGSTGGSSAVGIGSGSGSAGGSGSGIGSGANSGSGSQGASSTGSARASISV